ncbi:MAG: hypothetical protein ACOC9W_00425 [Persicimonas sp.]
MRKGMSRWLLIVSLLVLAGSVLTACTVSASGGIAAGLISTVLLLVAVSLGGTQAGCSDPDVGPCLSPAYDGGYDDPDVGPCLSPPPPDGGWDADQPDTDASDADASDADDADAYIGPCLSPPPPDTGWDADEPDASDAADTNGADTNDADTDGADAADGAEVGSADPERRRILDKMRQHLPADVLERLDDDDKLA